MVMMCEPLASCIEDLCSKAEFDEIIYLTPDGEKFNQKLRKLGLKRLFLHASSIEFTDNDEKIIVSAELPEKLHKILSEL